jgi:Mn2+/Fe2+ NRAMP family transporter
MKTDEATPTAPVTAPVPNSFLDYLRSFGPGLVIVLTWLGAGDVVDMGVSGSNFGYALMWVLVLAILMRFLFVSLIAKYQLCNPRGEGVLDGLARLHRWYAPGLLMAVVVMAHVYEAYMTVGCGEVLCHLTGLGSPWWWAILCNGVALVLVFRPSYLLLEWVFKVFLAILSVSFVGSAVWVGFNPLGVLQGLYRLEMPEQAGLKFPAGLVATAMIGAITGSLMNLVYPYFLEAKGWRGPQYRRVQLYDFLVAVLVMIVLNMAVWILGAELLFPDQKIEKLDDFPKLLREVLGEGGRWLFYLGIFAAVYTSVIGHAAGLAYLGTHAWLRWQHGEQLAAIDFRQQPLYRWLVLWSLIPPLIWTLPGMPDFVTLTLLSNSLQVALLPLLAGGLWWITASSRFIGPEYRNRWWENAVMALFFLLALAGTVNAVRSVLSAALGLAA